MAVSPICYKSVLYEKMGYVFKANPAESMK